MATVGAPMILVALTSRSTSASAVAAPRVVATPAGGEHRGDLPERAVARHGVDEALDAVGIPVEDGHGDVTVREVDRLGRAEGAGERGVDAGPGGRDHRRATLGCELDGERTHATGRTGDDDHVTGSGSDGLDGIPGGCPGQGDRGALLEGQRVGQRSEDGVGARHEGRERPIVERRCRWMNPMTRSPTDTSARSAPTDSTTPAKSRPTVAGNSWGIIVAR